MDARGSLCLRIPNHREDGSDSPSANRVPSPRTAGMPWFSGPMNYRAPGRQGRPPRSWGRGTMCPVSGGCVKVSGEEDCGLEGGKDVPQGNERLSAGAWNSGSRGPVFRTRIDCQLSVQGSGSAEGSWPVKLYSAKFAASAQVRVPGAAECTVISASVFGTTRRGRTLPVFSAG